MNGSEAHAHPLTITHDQTARQAVAEFEQMPLDKVEAEATSIRDTLTTAYNEVGESFNLKNLKVIAGTEQEQCGKIVDLNSRLKSAMKVSNSKRAAKDILIRNATGLADSEELAERGRMGQVIGFPGGEAMDPNWVSKQFREGLNLGVDGGLRNKINSSVEMKMPGDLAMNTLFKRPFVNPGAPGSYASGDVVASGWNPFTPRESGYVPILQRPIRLFDIVPIVPTDNASIEYMEETLFDNKAAATAEGASAPEAALALNRRVVHVEKIAVSIPVTEEQLDDVPEVNSYLNDRLPLMMSLRAESEVLSGNGTSPRIDGYLNRTGMLDYTLKDNADTLATVQVTKPIHDMLRLITKVKVESYTYPEVAFMHSYFLRDLFLQETTSAGFYLGNPQTGFAPTIWGLPIVDTTIFTWSKQASTGSNSVVGLVGGFASQSTMRIRRGFMIDVGISNDDFLKGQLRLRGTVRLALKVIRPKAFCKVLIAKTA